MLTTLCLSLLCSGVLYYLGSAIYFVSLHPLAAIPGPRRCAISRLPYWYASIRGVDVFWMKRLHDKYGPVVRFGPTDISYASAEGWQAVHGARLQEKAVEFAPQPVNGTPAIITTSHENHVRVRRMFSPAFSARSLKAQEPLFQRYAELLRYKVAEVGEDGKKPVDIGALLNYTTFDVMAELCFGENLQMLAKTENSPWVASIVASLKMLPLVAMINYYPLLRKVFFERFEPAWLAEQRKKHCDFSANLVNKRLRQGSQQPDVWNFVLEGKKGMELSLEEMHSNAELFMLAGSETTATLLSGTIFYLLKNPRSFSQLVEEVRHAFSSNEKMTFENLGSLKYLTACLKEASRIYPPVPIGSPRIIQSGGQTILGTYVPPETRVSCHHWSTYHLASNFTDPYMYVPERWLGAPRYAGDSFAAHQPFGSGYRNCIGQNMAMHEMRLLMATLLLNYDLTLCDESDDWADQKSFALWIKGPLMVKARPWAGTKAK